jgi:amidase
MSSEPYYFELIELARLIEARTLSPVDLTEVMLRRVEALQPRLRAFALVTPELALQQARTAEAELTAGQYRGALHGVPIGLKDLCYTAGIPTAAGMPLYRDFRPDFDATVTRRLAAAGAVCLGKLQLTEGAYGEHHPSIRAPVNPWGARHWCGGSSSGPGVATAAGLCFAAIGSDTGGSIRFPSAANGVTGLKPTWGRVSRYGIFELAASLDHIGPMCRSAADCGVVLGAIAGADPHDPSASQSPVPDYLGGEYRSLRGLRIGVDERFNTTGVDVITQNVLANVQGIFTTLGASLCAVQVPEVGHLVADWEINCAVETAAAHAETYPARRAEYGPVLADFIEFGRRCDGSAYQSVLLRRREFHQHLVTLLQRVDLLLVPAQSIASPTKADLRRMSAEPGHFADLLHFAAPFNMSGHPSITLPGGFSAQDTPIAFQLVARHFDEELLVRAGRAFQDVTPWHRRHPAV